MDLKTTDLNSEFQRKNRLWKICTESWDTDKNVSKFSFSSKLSKISYIFANISGPDPMHIFPKQLLHLNLGFNPACWSEHSFYEKRSRRRRSRKVPVECLNGANYNIDCSCHYFSASSIFFSSSNSSISPVQKTEAKLSPSKKLAWTSSTPACYSLVMIWRRHSKMGTVVKLDGW